MDRLQRRNPSYRPCSVSAKPPRPPRGPTFHPPPASRPLPEPSSPDERQRKKVRFANEAGCHQIDGRPVVNIPEAARSKLQVCDAKTAEFKFFKKLREQSGKRSHSYKHSHLTIEPNVSKQKQESQNVTLLRKVSFQRNSACCDDPLATPSKNEEISSERVNVQSSHSEYEKDTPHLNSDDYVPPIHVLTPIAQTSYKITRISRNIDREPISGLVFSEKRRKLLKLSAKTVSMGCAELLQRRSEFVGGILKRLGANNIIRKQCEGSARNRKTECRQAPATSKGHIDRLLDYKQSDFDLLTTVKTPGLKSSSNESFEFMALPCSYSQSLPGYIDCKNGLSRGHGGNEACEFMALPWVCTKDIPSSDQNGRIVHNHVSKLLLEDVEPCILGRSASGNELSLNVQGASYNRHGWSPMLSVPFSESFRDRMSFPHHVEQQDTVPCAIPNASWQPKLFSSIDRCISSSVGLDEEGTEETGWCDNSHAGSSRFDQLLVKLTASCLLGNGHEVLDHNDLRYISNFPISNNMVLSANTSHPSLMCSTPEYPYKWHPMSFHDSAIGVSLSAGLNEKHSREVDVSDNSDRFLPVLDQLPLLSTFPNDKSSIWDHHHLRYISSYPTKDCCNTLFLDANDSGLNSMSSCPEHPCKQYSNNFDDSSTELWSSMHQLQSHTSLGAILGLMSNESCYRGSGHHGLMLLQSNLNNDILGATDLSTFGSFSAMYDVREAPMLSSDGITW